MTDINLFRVTTEILCMISLSAVAEAQTSRYGWTQVTNPAAFAPRDGAGALVFNDQMWLLGGWNPGDKENFPKITNSEVWSSADGNTWTERFAEAPWEGRHCAGYAVYQGKMWIVGGDANQKHYQPDVWNTANGANWTRVNAATPWGNRQLHYTVVHDNKIWVMGGQSSPDWVPGSPEAQYNDVWNTTDGVTWNRVAEHADWSPRGMICGSVEFDGRMWIMGGGRYPTSGGSRTYLNDVWSSADGMNWTQATANAPWSGRNYHNVAVFDNRMWVLEGYSGNNGGNLKDVWYSSDGANWTELPDTPWAPRHAASVFVYDNALWVVAGNNMQSDVWRLDVVHSPEPSTAALFGAGLLSVGGMQWARHAFRRRRERALRRLQRWRARNSPIFAQKKRCEPGRSEVQ
jgi:hypothetical protein